MTGVVASFTISAGTILSHNPLQSVYNSMYGLLFHHNPLQGQFSLTIPGKVFTTLCTTCFSITTLCTVYSRVCCSLTTQPSVRHVLTLQLATSVGNVAPSQLSVKNTPLNNLLLFFPYSSYITLVLSYCNCTAWACWFSLVCCTIRSTAGITRYSILLSAVFPSYTGRKIVLVLYTLYATWPRIDLAPLLVAIEAVLRSRSRLELFLDGAGAEFLNFGFLQPSIKPFSQSTVG